MGEIGNVVRRWWHSGEMPVIFKYLEMLWGNKETQVPVQSLTQAPTLHTRIPLLSPSGRDWVWPRENKVHKRVEEWRLEMFPQQSVRLSKHGWPWPHGRDAPRGQHRCAEQPQHRGGLEEKPGGWRSVPSVATAHGLLNRFLCGYHLRDNQSEQVVTGHPQDTGHPAELSLKWTLHNF